MILATVLAMVLEMIMVMIYIGSDTGFDIDYDTVCDIDRHIDCDINYDIGIILAIQNYHYFWQLYRYRSITVKVSQSCPLRYCKSLQYQYIRYAILIKEK